MVHRTHLLLDQVEALQRTGQWNSALDLCRRLYDQALSTSAPDDLLEVILRTAFIYGALAEREIAVDHFELVVTIADAKGDKSRAARALNGLGVIYQAMGDIEKCSAYYALALNKAFDAGDRLTRGDVEMNLGIIANIRGDLRTALGHYEAAYSEYEAITHRGRLSKVLNNMGMLHIDLEQYEEASEALERGLNITQSIPDPATEGILHANRAELFLSINDLESARASCDHAFEIASRLGDDVLKTDVLKCYGILFKKTDKPHLAESHFEQSIALAKTLDHSLLEAEATRELSLVLRDQGRNREALEALNSAHSLFSAIQAKPDEADIADRLAQLESDFLALVAEWGESIEAKDRYTSGHCQRVADYACRIADAAGMGEWDLRWFRMGAFLHDVGKTEVPAEILNKPGRLTDEERLIIEQHTVVGDEMLSSIEFPWDIRPMVRSHHERWDGRGYPDGLSGLGIPYTARILKIADVFDALTSTRSYREPLSATQAFEIMLEDQGSYDPELFALFSEILPQLAGDRESQPSAVSST